MKRIILSPLQTLGSFQYTVTLSESTILASDKHGPIKRVPYKYWPNKHIGRVHFTRTTGPTLRFISR